MIRVGQHIVNPTMFPDKTSQVWHLPQDALKENSIYWEFESESELIHVCQLADLLKSANSSLVTKVITLTCPYLPYARQHKRISNDSTFSLETFCKTIEQFIDVLHTFDVHDESFFELDGKCRFLFTFKNTLPKLEIDNIVESNDIDLMVFADKSAQRKYQPLTDIASVGCDKVRDPSDGKITSFKINEPIVEDLSILVQDDLCDGGKTFMDVAKVLKPFKPKKLILYVSHGIFSRGTQCLFEAGYDKIYTRKGEVAQ